MGRGCGGGGQDGHPVTSSKREQKMGNLYHYSTILKGLSHNTKELKRNVKKVFKGRTWESVERKKKGWKKWRVEKKD